MLFPAVKESEHLLNSIDFGVRDFISIQAIFLTRESFNVYINIQKLSDSFNCFQIIDHECRK